MEVEKERGGAGDVDGQRGEDGCAGEEAEGEATLPPEEKESGDGESDLELDEGEREDEASREVALAAKRDEAGAIEQKEKERELAHDEREGHGKEGEEEEQGRGFPAGGECGEERLEEGEGCEEKKKVDEGEDGVGGLEGQKREWDEEEGSEGRRHEGQRVGVAADEGALQALLGGVVVELRGAAGAEHVAGGVGSAEVDVATADDGDAGDEGAELEDEESSEVEPEASWREEHRVGP